MSNLIKTEEKNRKFTGIFGKPTREKLNAIVKNLLTFKKETPKRDFVQTEIKAENKPLSFF